MTPRQILLRLGASIQEWPTGRTDGTLAVLWSLAAWVFVLGATVLIGVIVATSQHLVDADLVQDLVEDDKSVVVLAVLGLVVTSWLLVQHRVGVWRRSRDYKVDRPLPLILMRADPDVAGRDRAAAGVWL